MLQDASKRALGIQSIYDLDTTRPLEKATSGIGVRELLTLMWRRRFFIAGASVVGLIFLILAVLSMRDIYGATATLVLERNEARMLEAVTQIQGAERDRIAVETEMDVIESRIFASRIVDEFNLVENPWYNPYLPNKEEGYTPVRVFRTLVKQGIGLLAVLLDIEREEKPAEPPNMEVQRDRTITAFLSNLNLARSGESLAVTVHVRSPEAQLSSALANAVARIYVDWSRERAREEMSDAVNFLKDRATKIATRIADNERAVADLIQANQLSSGRGEDIVRQRIDEINTQLTNARVELAVINARQEQGRRVLAGVEAIEETTLTSPLLSSLRNDRARLMREQAQYSSNFGGNHPQVLKTTAELTSVGGMIDEEIRRMIKELAGEKKIVENRIEQLDQQLLRLQDTVHERSLAEIRLREIERDLAADQRLHDLILARIGSLDPFSEIVKASARVVSFAETPVAPAFPQKRRILVGGTLGIVILAVLLAVVLEAVDAKIRSGQEISRSAQVANLANIPRIRRPWLGIGWHPFIYLMRRRDSAYAEAIRSLYLAFRARLDLSNSVLLFSGTGRGSGCSSAALGFALSSASDGLETLYLNLDRNISSLASLRLPCCTIQDLDQPEAFHSLGNAIRPVPGVDGLQALAAPGLLDPGKGLQPVRLEQMRQLLEALRSAYDLVIVDCAPVLETEDASWLGFLVDAIVLVVRFGRVSEQELVGAVSRLQINRAPLTGTVLNAVEQRAQTVREPLGVMSYPVVSRACLNT